MILSGLICLVILENTSIFIKSMSDHWRTFSLPFKQFMKFHNKKMLAMFDSLTWQMQGCRKSASGAKTFFETFSNRPHKWLLQMSMYYLVCSLQTQFKIDAKWRSALTLLWLPLSMRGACAEATSCLAKLTNSFRSVRLWCMRISPTPPCHGGNLYSQSCG